jgi:hypothetical protein
LYASVKNREYHSVVRFEWIVFLSVYDFYQKLMKT